MPENISKKLFVILALSGIFFGFLPLFQEAKAAPQFSVSLDYNFSFEDNGKAHVIQKVTSTNLTNDFFASEYSIKVHNDKVTDVSGSDGLGAIGVTSKVSDGSTTIVAKLNQQVVGLNKSVTFQINYATDSFAIKRGKVWDINIPQVETSENVTAYQIVVSVPDSFGKLGKITPQPANVVSEGGRRTYSFSKESLKSSRIGASFGDFQEFKFILKYRYKNDRLYNVKATIALPPDTEYQALDYKTLDPKPYAMRADENGNYLADYVIRPSKNLEVVASGVVKIIDSDQALQNPLQWTDSSLAKFTKNDTYIESENQQIQKKAKELKNIEDIYNYVVTTVKYDYTRIDSNSLNRRGALATINQPDKSICVDFSDLFVALARAKGIPARGLVGFGYSDDSSLRPTKVEGLVNSTILHAWPEYWDKTKKRWIQVDPTWGATTGGVDYFHRLDTNHFVFVINGTSSTLPIPAGGYKTSSNQVDDVDVKFSDEKFDQAVAPSISLTGNKIISGFPQTSQLILENKTGRAIFNSKITITGGSNLHLIKPNSIDTGILLPFAKNTYDVKLRSDSLLDNITETLDVKFTGLSDGQKIDQQLKKNVLVRPFFSFEIPQLILLFLFSITVLSWIHHFKTKEKPASQIV